MSSRRTPISDPRNSISRVLRLNAGLSRTVQAVDMLPGIQSSNPQRLHERIRGRIIDSIQLFDLCVF